MVIKEEIQRDALNGTNCAHAKVCPQPLAKIAMINDVLWRNRFNPDKITRDSIERGQINQLANQFALAYAEYGLNLCNVSWEEIQQAVRYPDGSPMSRRDLQENYGYKRDPVWALPDQLGKTLDKIPELATDLVPIYFDRWVHPGLAFVLAIFTTLLAFLVFAMATMKITSYPKLVPAGRARTY
jgi:hypothetical protein